MCRKDYNIYSRKGKHLNYDKRCSIERWYNIDKRTKVEIAKLLDRNEKTIRNEIKRGLVCIKTQHWEGDLVIGKRKKSDCLLVFIERMTREEIIFKIPGKKSENVVNKIDKNGRRFKGKISQKIQNDNI